MKSAGRKYILIAAFMLFMIFASSMLAYLTISPGPEKAKQVTALNILGYFFGILFLPFLLPLRVVAGGRPQPGRFFSKHSLPWQARLALVGGLFLPNIVVRLMGQELWLASPVSSGLMAFGNGLVATLMFGCFFSFAGEYRVFWAALSYSAGIFAYNLILGPGRPVLMPYVFSGTGHILTLAGILLMVFLTRLHLDNEKGGIRNEELEDPVGKQGLLPTQTDSKRQSFIPHFFLPVLAVLVIFGTNSFTNQLFLISLSVPFPPGFHPSVVVLVLALPLLGLFASLWWRRFLNVFLILCSIVFLLAPSLLLFSRSETLFVILYTLNLIAIRMNTAVIPAAIVDQYRNDTAVSKKGIFAGFLAWLLPISIHIIHTYVFLPPAPLKIDNAYAVVLLTIAAVVYFILCYKGIIGVSAAAPDTSAAKPLCDNFKEYGLSEREEEVALLMVREGLGNKEIGNRLFISIPTVKSHVSQIYRKLGVKSRAAFLAKVLKNEK